MHEQTTDVRRALVEHLADEYGWLSRYPEDEAARGAVWALVALGGRLGFDKSELGENARELAGRDR